MPSKHRYHVDVDDDAKEELRRLIREDSEVAKAAIKLALDLRGDPYLGKKLRNRPGVGDLSDCRGVLFDRADWKRKPRYRLVYRNEPSDGAPHVVAVLSVGLRKGLAGYRVGVTRRKRRIEAQGGA